MTDPTGWPEPTPGVRLVQLAPGDEQIVAGAAELFDDPPLPGPTTRFLAASGCHLLFALAGPRAVGFVSGVEVVHPDKPEEMLLYELAVDPSFRRRGIGAALVRALLDVAARRGCRGMWVPVDADDEAALATYRAAGASGTEAVAVLTWELPAATAP